MLKTPLIYGIGGATDFGGLTNTGGGFIHATVVSLRLSSTTSVHEIGHTLGLIHPRGFSETSPCEHVTRDPNDTDDPNDPDDTYFNADMRGDKVVDTAAMPWTLYDGSCDCYPLIENCEYQEQLSDLTDCQGTPYEIFPSDVVNLMGNINPCQDFVITTGQGIRMRERIELDPQGLYVQAETTIAALYEPYTGEYYEIGPQSTEHNPPLFQPGFDYSFISCSCQGLDNLDCDLPCDYENTGFHNNHTIVSSYSKFESAYSSITHPNHTAILIPILDEAQPRRCYDNWNRGAINGSVLKFEDNVFNNNVTITVKDSLQINSETLIQNLDTGLYKIEKNFEDGTTQETIMQKGNN